MRQLVDRSMQILVGLLAATVIGVSPLPSFAQYRKNLAYALDDKDIRELFEVVGVGTPVTIEH